MCHFYIMSWTSSPVCDTNTAHLKVTLRICALQKSQIHFISLLELRRTIYWRGQRYILALGNVMEIFPAEATETYNLYVINTSCRSHIYVISLFNIVKLFLAEVTDTYNICITLHNYFLQRLQVTLWNYFLQESQNMSHLYVLL